MAVLPATKSLVRTDVALERLLADARSIAASVDPDEHVGQCLESAVEWIGYALGEPAKLPDSQESTDPYTDPKNPGFKKMAWVRQYPHEMSEELRTELALDGSDAPDGSRVEHQLREIPYPDDPDADLIQVWVTRVTWLYDLLRGAYPESDLCDGPR